MRFDFPRINFGLSGDDSDDELTTEAVIVEPELVIVGTILFNGTLGSLNIGGSELDLSLLVAGIWAANCLALGAGLLLGTT